MFIKCPDNGIQVGPVLPEGKTDLSLASDANFIYALATTFHAPFSSSPLAVRETAVTTSVASK